MKKNLILTIVCLLFVTAISAQTLNDAGELYNTAGEQLKSKNFVEAIKSFDEALVIAKGLGEEGSNLASTIEKTLPRIKLQYCAEDLVKNKKLDEAIQYLTEAIDDSDKVNDANTAKTARSYLTSIYVSKTGSAYGAKNYEEAIQNSDLALKYNPKSAKAYLYRAYTFEKMDKEDEMIEAINKAVEYAGTRDVKTATDARRTGTTYLNNKAQKLIANNQFAEAITALDQSIALNSDIESTWYYKTSCLNNLKKFDDAIETGLIGLETTEENKDTRCGINIEIAKAYEAKGDKANACTYYKKAAESATFKEEATQKMTDILKCN